MTSSRNRLAFRAALVVTAALALAACGKSMDDLNPFNGPSSKDSVETRAVLPVHFKDEIVATMPGMFEDPTNIREAYYSDPVIDPKAAVSVYTSCVRFNARDSTKQYLGSREYIAYYFGGRLNQLVPATPGQCSYATWKPFPELEKICFAQKCP